jgi:hypothetical protein
MAKGENEIKKTKNIVLMLEKKHVLKSLVKNKVIPI